MTQNVRSLILTVSMVTAAVSSVNAFAAKGPSSCAEGFQQAANDYRQNYQKINRDTKRTAEILAPGSLVVFGGSAFAKAKVAGGLIAGAMVAGAAYSYWSSCKELDHLENSAMIWSVYQNSGGNVEIPEQQDLLLETFADQSLASNCSIFSAESLPAPQRELRLAAIPEVSKKLVIDELVKRMESGELCDKDNSPKTIGEIVAELKDYEKTKTTGTF